MANAIIIQQVTALATRAAGEFNTLRSEVKANIDQVNDSLDNVNDTLRGRIGDLTTLNVVTPANKASLVLAYNELVGIVAGINTTAQNANALIDDTADGTSTTKTYSANKITGSIKTSVDTAVAGLVDGSIAGLDTLKELAAAINNDTSYAATVTTALDGKLVKTANLSDLSNLATARTNLAVYSKTEVDAAIKVVTDSIGDLSTFDAVATFTSALSASVLNAS